jgi:hypothetical protein
VPGTGEPGHLWSDLGQEHLREAPFDPGNSLQPPELSFVGTQPFSQLGTEVLNPLVQRVNVREVFLQEEAVMLGDPSLQSLL